MRPDLLQSGCSWFAAAVLAAASLAPTAAAFERTEEREPCTSSDPRRQPFFGETHLHTGLSYDASIRLVRPTPRDAYRFAMGEPISGTDPNGFPSRSYQLDRPLDFGAVTDHSEQFGEMGICTSTDLPGRFSFECQLLTGFYWQPGIVPGPFQRGLATAAFGVLPIMSGGSSSRSMRLPVCENGQGDCDASELAVWEEMQAAAEEAYDRSAACRFTSFVAYENTATPASVNWHRNVIFRNERVIERPITAIDMARVENPDPNRIPPLPFVPGGPDVEKFWDGLQAQCLEAGNGCDVLTIPHNSNLGPALGPIPALFSDPPDAALARKRQAFEPLVEIYQHKGSSECRFDPRFGAGVGTNDELCDFELLEADSILAASGVGVGGGAVGVPPEDFDPRSYVRNVLKAGLTLEQQLGVNPFKLGIVASTDSHNGTMGYTPEDTSFGGHLGFEDAVPVNSRSNIQNSAGGLAVVWAEENSRDAIFEAMRRKETYGTSGTRPVVRFFGGWNFNKNECKKDFVERGYRKGVPMGSDLPPRQGQGRAPSFIVAAWMDDFVGTPLQQIQIVKGWVDEAGETHERIVAVAGNPNNGAGVDAQCNPTGRGFEELCSVWSDPDFDRGEPAFYYARVIENPVCRYSTHVCRDTFGVDPLSPDCEEQLAGKPAGAQLCCSNQTTSPIVQPVIQERAWTSPIWYTP
jgi:hypothetical protein